MCWSCGPFRPYDLPPVPDIKRTGTKSYVLGGVEYTAQDNYEEDPDEILRLIDAGCIISLDTERFGWEDLASYPPLDSNFFAKRPWLENESR